MYCIVHSEYQYSQGGAEKNMEIQFVLQPIKMNLIFTLIIYDLVNLYEWSFFKGNSAQLHSCTVAGSETFGRKHFHCKISGDLKVTNESTHC